MRVIDIEPGQVIVANRQRRPLGNIDGLIASIQSVGLLHPIVIGADGILKVGYRRLEAFRRMDRDTIPAHVAENLDDVIEALRAERDENVQREELPPTVMVERGRELQEAEREAARERMIAAHSSPAKFAEQDQGNARDKVGEALGVSGETWRKADAVISAAEADPETFGDLPVLMDTKNVHRAHKEMVKRQRAERRQEIISDGQSATIPEKARLICGDFSKPDFTAWSLEAGSIDVIITDPPYPQKYLPLYEDLAKNAAYLLRPGGLLLAMCGQSYLPSLFELMCPHLIYRWTLAYLTPGGQSPQIWPRRFNTFWKPVLVFSKETLDGDDWHGDVIKSDVNDNDKRFHKWGQSESGMARLVESFTKDNDLILDPFCGGGTTGVVALQLNRRFVGIDIDSDQISITKGRIHEQTS